jgi:hypothetical protein
VWKLPLCLIEHRPDLDLFTVPAKPSGLTIIRALDRNNRNLTERADAILEHYRHMTLTGNLDDRKRQVRTINNDLAAVNRALIPRSHG